jgi:hypothetical protein
MNKLRAAAAMLALSFLASTAHADVVTTLHLEFESGAVFDGTVTFNDGYAGMLDASGTLNGGPWGTKAINWTWLAGTGGANPQDMDGNPGTYEDWLMDGMSTLDDTIYIGLSWAYPVAGAVPTIVAAPDILFHGINIEDRIVDGQFGAVPEPAMLSLLGLGMAGLAASRRRPR